MFRSLRHRNFRLYFVGQFISLCGSWIQGTALSWLMYRLTKDPFMLGLVAFVSQFPVFLLGFVAGHVVDRFNHRRLVLVMQSLAMLQATILAALTLSGRIQIWQVFALALMLGLIYCFEIPARQVFVGELVPVEDRHNAIALNSTVVNGSRIIAPALAGLAIGLVGEGWCFALNAASYIAVLAGLMMMREVRQAPAGARGSAWEEIGNGLAYVRGKPALAMALGLLMSFSMVGLPIYVLLPIFSAEMGEGARGLGVLSSMTGVGATIGALRLARRVNSGGLARIVARSLTLFGLSILGLSLCRRFDLSALLMGVVGFSAIQILAGVNTLLQYLSSDRFRGRVMGFYSMIFIGLSPVGSFVVGALAKHHGVRATVGIQACLLLIVGIASLGKFPRLLAQRLEDPGAIGPPPSGPIVNPAPGGGP